MQSSGRCAKCVGHCSIGVLERLGDAGRVAATPCGEVWPATTAAARDTRYLVKQLASVEPAGCEVAS